MVLTNNHRRLGYFLQQMFSIILMSFASLSLLISRVIVAPSSVIGEVKVILYTSLEALIHV